MAEPTGAAVPHGPSSPPGAAPARGRPGGVLQKMGKGQITHVVAVGSGKGGVGKSSTTALLAAELRRRGLAVGLLDADVTGPSIPKLFGLSGPLVDKGEGIEATRSAGGIPVVSSQFLVEDEQAPVIWRGPLVTRLIMQFFGGVNWGKLDYLLIDMPPGTSDVPLTVFQTIPIDGMVFVFTPQDLAAMIVKKAMNMARDLHVPLLGAVENMSYLACPHCHERIRLFGAGGIDKIAEEYGIAVLAKLPVDPALSDAADHGGIEGYASPEVAALGDAFLAAVARQTSDTVTTL
ncbi:MAG: Mrp/NBP35 family ATP-binding protein [Thermoplasmata archaeon]|nr:Mrp/NBP35 family ATP-binding protein [Thermoplasmata archaeon]MCI4361695.1 Mrp/NBP35 family ATP-binding protein [Thermoplasmata archaeon]